MTRTARLTTLLPAAPLPHHAPRATLPVWVPLLVALLALLVYANSLRNGLAMDDMGIITNNPAVQEQQWAELWSGSYWPAQDGPIPDILYRPLTIFSYVATHALAPAALWPNHAVNVGLHTLCGVLVTLLAWRLVKNLPAALGAGVLFAVHPLHTEVVAGVVGRAELLAAFWSLLALLIYLPQDPLHEPLTTARHWAHGWLVAVCFLLALLSKETPVPMLLAFPLIDFWRWSLADRRQFHPLFARCWRYYLPLALAFGVYLVARIHAVGLMNDVQRVHPLVNPLVEAGILERILTPFMLLAKYVVLFLYPHPLACDYSQPSLMPTANPLDPMVLLGALLVFSGVLMVVSWWRRRPALALTILLFALSYALVANVLRIGTIFGERLFYWPSVFVCMGLGYAAACLWRQLDLRALSLPRRMILARSLALTLALALIILLAWRTIVRNPDWADNESLAISTARDNPHSAKALGWAGQVLVNLQQPQWTEFGESLLQKAIALYPHYAPPYWNLAKSCHSRGETGAAMIYIARMALGEGGSTTTHGIILRIRDELRHDPIHTYAPALEAARQEHPQDPVVYLALAWSYRAQGQDDAADEALVHALQLRPDYAEATAELGQLRLERGDAPSAVQYLTQYAQRTTRNPEARCQMAFALMKLDVNLYPRCLDEADRAIQLVQALDPAGHADKIRELRAELNTRRLKMQSAAVPTPALISHVATGATGRS